MIKPRMVKRLNLSVKKNKTLPTTAPLRIAVKLHSSCEVIEALLDSGASKSIINGSTFATNVQVGHAQLPASRTVFATMRGSVASKRNGCAEVLFSAPQGRLTYQTPIRSN